MLKLKHSLLLLLVLFLAACGSQAELPEAVQEAANPIGEISSAELEQALDSTALTAQGGYYNPRHYNKFILKKIVIGKNDHTKYKLVVVCKVPGKGHKRTVVAGAKLKSGETSHPFYVSKKYTECASLELEKFGDKSVTFKYANGHPEYSSGVKYSGKLYYWGKHYDYKASKFFHVKHGTSVWTTHNAYKEEIVEKKLELIVSKKFQDKYDYGNTLYPTDYYLDLKLICEGRDPIKLTLDSNLTFKGHYADLYGKKCYISEKWHDDEYKFVNFSVDYDDGKSTKRTYNDSWKVHEGGKDYEYAQNDSFHVSPHATKLVIVIVNLLKEKEEEKKLVLEIIKKFDKYDWQENYHYPQYPGDYDHLSLTLICDGARQTINLDSSGKYYDDHASDLYGKKCYIEERFKDDQYKLKQVVGYYGANDETPKDYSYGDSYDTGDGYDTGKIGEIEIKDEYKKLTIIVGNKMGQKHPQS